MEFKGTIGKWQMTTSALECDHNTEVATIWGDSEYGEGATLIAHIDKGAGNEKAIANAQLIAAAPELLQALQSLANGVRERGFAGHLSDYLKHADTILSKALGKEAGDE